MSLQKILPYVLILTLVLAVISCNDDWLRAEYDTTMQWEGGFEGPLIFGSLNLKDLLNEYDNTGFVSEDSSGFLYLAYSKDTVLSAPEMLEVPDQEFIQLFFRVDTNIPGWMLGPIGDTIAFDQDKGFEFKRTGDERIDSVQIKSGSMSIYVRSTIKHTGILTITSDDVLVGGKPFHEVIMISDPSGTFEQTTSISMEGGTIRLDNSVPDSTSISLNYTFELINSGNDILSSEEVQIINSFRNLEFSGAFGYLGAYDSVLIDKAQLDFGLLEGNFEGSIKLANPQLNITIDNSMGIPFAVELLDLEAHFKDGSGTAIIIDPSANPIRINAPSISQVGQTIRSITNIDNSNSNINEAATTDLTGFQYSVRAMGNPDGVQDNFILDTSKLAISIEGLIPIDLRIQDFVLSDTFDFDLTSDEDSDFGPDNVDYMMMRMETDNSMPIDLGIQVYFIDTTQNWLRLDSLFGADKDIFKSGVLNADGRVIQATNKVTRVELTKTQIGNALDANKLMMKVYIETAEDGSRDVKFYSDYSLDFKLGARLELNVTIESEENNK